MAGRKSEAIVARTIQRAADQLAEEYRQERSADSERLHEAFMAIIEDQQPNIEVLVFVLELIRYDVLAEKHRELFKPAGQPVTRADLVGPHLYNGVSHGMEETPVR